jgi:plastocyanin
MSLKRGAALIGLSVALAGCRGKPAAPTDPTTPPATTITITSAGVNPAHVDVKLGARVLFVNKDNRAHNMSSDPHPEHSDCPDINQAGFLQAGQSRETGNLVETGSCGFHDHNDPGNLSLRGSITIQ